MIYKITFMVFNETLHSNYLLNSNWYEIYIIIISFLFIISLIKYIKNTYSKLFVFKYFPDLIFFSRKLVNILIY
jgi:hypothetical protein